MKRISYNFRYKVKQNEGKEKQTIIEGFANRAFAKGEKVVDRGMEHIPVNEWKVKNWLKNPIILFNHDKNIPVGRGLDIKVTDEGLWIKAMISQSDVPEIKKVRDLIEEKILNSFSVGIDPEEEYEEDGVIHLRGCELLETSVVSLPMNQESQFNLSTKMIKEKSLNKLKEDITKEKGAVLASEIHKRIGEMQESNEEFSREDILVKIAEESKISLDELFEFLAGNVIEANDDLISSLSSNLSLDQNRLFELNAVDLALNKPNIIRPEEQEDEPNEEKEDKDEKDGDKEPLQADQQELAPEKEGENLDEDNQSSKGDKKEGIADAHELAEDTEPLEEDPDDEPLEDEEEKEKKKDIQTESFNDCMSRLIREAMEDGKPQDQAIAFALSKCRNEKSCLVDSDTWNKIFDDIDKHKKNLMSPQEIAPQGYVESSPGDNHLQEARQTNVLLGQLIGEMQALKQILGGAMLAAPQSLALNGQRLNAEVSKEKQENLDILTDYHRKLERRLKRLGV